MLTTATETRAKKPKCPGMLLLCGSGACQPMCCADICTAYLPGCRCSAKAQHQRHQQ
jgi:hypothetical protein